MCRSIKPLRYPDRAPSDEEIQAAALQFVRKVSGYRVPSKANAATFHQAVGEVSAAVRRMFDELPQTRGRAPIAALSAPKGE